MTHRGTIGVNYRKGCQLHSGISPLINKLIRNLCNFGSVQIKVLLTINFRYIAITKKNDTEPVSNLKPQTMVNREKCTDGAMKKH